MMEQRKHKRYPIRLPVRVLRHGSSPFFAHGETRNLSSRGVLFVCDQKVELGERIEYVISWPAAADYTEPMDLYCLGKVLRITSEPGGQSFAVAATVERYAFTRIRD
ncbi:MAG: PilZ domain-containing protein [Bryobacteraceae bacterium]